MINAGYITYDPKQSKTIQNSLFELTTIRIGKITEILTSSKPSQIPFQYNFPIVEQNDYSEFLKETMKHHKFKDLPNFIQEKIFVAEKINFYNNLFKDYLIKNKMSEAEFEKKNPKTKLDIFYDFLFSNKIDIGITIL